MDNYDQPSRSYSAGSFGEEDDLMDDHSSTSTAGPPPDSPHHTGQFARSAWQLATAHEYRSGDESTGSSYDGLHDRFGDQTGSFQPMRDDDGNNATGSFPRGNSHSRTLSNTSASVSPMGSSVQQEWAKSFRVFNTSRYLGASFSRSREVSGSYIYRSTMLNAINARTSMSLGPDNERASFLGVPAPHHQRQGSLFSASTGGSGYHFTNSLSPELRAAGSLFAATSPPLANLNLQGSSGSPLLSIPSQQFSSAAPSPRNGLSGGGLTGKALATFALGGGLSLVSALTPCQRELPMLFNTLRSYLSLNGKTIIVGDERHPLEIKRGALIGTGGFAKVFVGLNTIRGELVAIKEINIADVEDVSALAAIESEFGLLKSLRHPNIVNYHLFEHSKSQKVCRIVMELLAGDSTLNLLRKYGTWKETILRRLARSLLNGISFIHKEGIFHRDIKPANILVSHRGEVKLCDFGCSKRVSELTKASSFIIGTPVYMAPELIKGEADHKADIWSMACSLFELATGRLPWYHSNVRDNLPLMFYITTTYETPLDVASPQDVFADFSPEFLSFMSQCFTRDPSRRPEAVELLYHPWIMGPRGVPVCRSPPATSLLLQQLYSESPPSLARPGTAVSKQSDSPSLNNSALENEDSFSSGEQDKSSVATSAHLHIDDETMCQLELEGVSAANAVDLCRTLMTSPALMARMAERRQAAEAVQTTEENSPMVTRTLSVPSPSLSNRGPVSGSGGDTNSPNVSLEHSILHSNFQYTQLSLGASAGNFVLPVETPEVAPQQYLRINEEGYLDFATLPDEDTEVTLETTHLKSSSVDSSIFAVSQSGHVLSPGKTGSFSRGSVSPGNPAPGTAFGTERHSSPVHASAAQSRGESPQRPVALSLSTSHIHPSTPPLIAKALVPSPLQQPPPPALSGPSSSPLQAGSSFDDVSAQTPLSPASLSTGLNSSFRLLPDRAKPQADGKLHMSFAFTTAPGLEMSVNLNVDVSDVHCRMVDNQANFLVAFSDDLREQITSQIKEASAQSQSAMESGQFSGSRRPSPYEGTALSGSTSPGHPLHPLSPAQHFYNSESYLSASRSSPRQRARHFRLSPTEHAHMSPSLTGSQSPVSGAAFSSSVSRASTPAASAGSDGAVHPGSPGSEGQQADMA